MSLSGKTKPFAVIGHPIGHSLSPVMHNASMKSIGYDGIYLALDVHPDRLMSTLPVMQDMGFSGVNLTVPHKEIAFQGLSQLDETARLYGAVNTVAFNDNEMIGYNTDGYGFLKALEESFGKRVENDRVFILGCGGAGRAIALLAAKEGASSIILADINQSRIEQLINEVSSQFPSAKIDYAIDKESQINQCKSADLVIQASPIGMNLDDEVLLPKEAFHSNQRVFDLIYMYPETGILSVAKKEGAEISNGLGMLLHQGAKSFHIWTGEDPDINIMRSSLKKEVYSRLK